MNRVLNSINLGAIQIIIVLSIAKCIPPLAQNSFVPRAPIEDWSTLTLHDPQMGSHLAGLGADRTRRLLMVIGDCGSCNETKVRAFAASDSHIAATKAIFISPESGLHSIPDEFRGIEGVTFNFMTEAQKAQWNPSFLPRIYAIYQRGRLVYIQAPSDSVAQATILAWEALGGRKN